MNLKLEEVATASEEQLVATKEEICSRRNLSDTDLKLLMACVSELAKRDLARFNDIVQLELATWR